MRMDRGDGSVVSFMNRSSRGAARILPERTLLPGIPAEPDESRDDAFDVKSFAFKRLVD